MTGKRITNAIRRLLGRGTACSQVQERLYAYAWCEPDLSEAECTEIMRHLAVCECCRAEFDEIEATIDAVGPLLYPDDALPPFDVEAMAKSITERIEQGDTGREIALVHEFTQGSEPRFADESPYGGLCHGAFAWLGANKRLAAMAACAVLLVAGPVLAHVAGAVRDCFDDAEDPIETGEQVALHRETLPVPEMPGDAVKPAETDASASAREIDSDITDSLDAELDRQAARAEIEAMLPHTEAEYEAWARREYPHIMWLYDFLIDPSNGTEWNGTWQQLLLQSAEIFRFDWPRSVNESNCQPRIQALISSAHVVGFEIQFCRQGAYCLPPMSWADRKLDCAGEDLRFDLRPTQIHEPQTPRIPCGDWTKSEIAALSANPPLERRTLVYLAAGCRFVDMSCQTRYWGETSKHWSMYFQEINSLLPEVSAFDGERKCRYTLVAQLMGLFEKRRVFLASLADVRSTKGFPYEIPMKKGWLPVHKERFSAPCLESFTCN